jgi:chromosome segregation ATPase
LTAAGRTNTDAIRDLEKAVAVLEQRLDALVQQLDESLAERTATLRRDLDRLDAVYTRTVEPLTRHNAQLAVLEQQVADLKKAAEESDRKRWMLVVAVIGSFLTLAANLVLSFLRK